MNDLVTRTNGRGDLRKPLPRSRQTLVQAGLEEVQQLEYDLDQARQTIDEQKVRIVALETELEAFRGHIGLWKKRAEEAADKMDRAVAQRAEADTILILIRNALVQVGVPDVPEADQFIHQS